MVAKKAGFFQKVGGMLEGAASKLDNAMFKTDAANRARKDLDNPEFAAFLARTGEHEGVDVASLQEGGNERKLGATYERYEKLNSTIDRAKDVLTNQFKEQMGVDISPADLATVENYFKDAAFEDPKTFDRLAKTFEKGVAMQAEVAQRRGKLEALKDKFGRDKVEMMEKLDQGGIWGNKETRAWAREEARDRGYGPVRSWFFKTFSANSAIAEKIQEGSKISMEKRQEIFAHIRDAQDGIETAEGKVHDKLIAKMLSQSDFAVKAIEIAREKAVKRVALAIERPEDLNIEDLVAERKRLVEFSNSDFAPEDGVLEAPGVGGKEGQTFQELSDQLELAVKYRVDLKMEELVTRLADPAANPGFSELLQQVQSVVAELSDGTPNGKQTARIQVAEILANRSTTGLTATKSMLVSMVINHLSR